jgi:hypothetical protein
LTGTLANGAGHWYWVTGDYNLSGTCHMHVYNDDGSSAASEVIDTETTGNQMGRVNMGNVQALTAAATVYWDNLLVNFSSNIYPILPP